MPHKQFQYHWLNLSIVYQSCSAEEAKIFGRKKEVGTVLENHFEGFHVPWKRRWGHWMGEKKLRSFREVSCWLKRAGRENKAENLEGNPKCSVRKLLVLAALCPCPCNEECCINFSSSCISYSLMIHLLLRCLYHFLFYGIKGGWCMQT